MKEIKRVPVFFETQCISVTRWLIWYQLSKMSKLLTLYAAAITGASTSRGRSHKHSSN